MHSTTTTLLCLALFVLQLGSVHSQDERPIVVRPESTRQYTTVLTIDAGGMKCLIPSIIAMEVEDSIKRYIMDNPELFPDEPEFETEEDFIVLLADYFDAMSGVSGGSWTTAYLSSKGGNGAARSVFANRRIRREYGVIVPGEARGLEVFFLEYGASFYPGGIPQVNISTPPMVNVSTFPNFSTLLTTNPLAMPAQIPFELPTVEIPGVNAPVYPVEGLEEALDAFLGDVKLSELSTFYVVHAYDLNTRRNVYFIHDNKARPAVTYTSNTVTRNSPRRIPRNVERENVEYMPDNDLLEDVDFYMRDVTRGSSAVAAFHEAKVMSPVDNDNITYSFIDGATITSNPALQALIFLTSEPTNIPIGEIAMISLGTGISYDEFHENADSGLLGWLLNNELMSIMTDGGAENVQSQVDYLFYGNPGVRPNQYLRVQVSAERNTTEGDALSRVTDPEDLPVFSQIGSRAARRYRTAINHFVEEFVFASDE